MQLMDENKKAATLDSLPDAIAQLETEIGKVIIGQRDVVRQSMIAVACGGHCILRGVPGLAKTLLVKTLAQHSQQPWHTHQLGLFRLAG